MTTTLEESFIVGQEFLDEIIPPTPPDPNVIPPMDDPMGKHWRQPDHSGFMIDDNHVLMTRKEFEALADYSQSQPSGVYPGKMWRTLSRWPYRIPMGPVRFVWCLRWFGISEDPAMCTNNCREILLVD